MDLCRDANILCCSVDKNWHESTFITPASFKENELTVSISTGGKSCRYARLVKDNIKRCLSTSENSELLLIGTDHRYIPLEERELLHTSINNNDTPKMLSLIVGIHEFMIINTCNRIEIFCLTKPDSNIEKILLKLMNFDILKNSKYYIKRGFEAFKHLTLVTSGIYSQLIGENHIASQIKEAFALSEKNQWSGGILKSCVESAIFISKKIRNSVSSIIKPTEIENLTVKYLKSLKNIDLKKDSIAILGTGKIGISLIEEFLKQNSANISWFYHKNIPQIPNSTNIQLLPLNKLNAKIHKFDIVISALKLDKPVLTGNNTTTSVMTIIDLGMPRNIVGFYKNIIDLEKLKYWYRKEICLIDTVLPICEKIINENIINYEKIFNSLKNWNKKE